MFKNEDFVEASAYLRVLEKRMLNSDSINRIIDAPNALEALRLITQNSNYDFNSLKRLNDYELVIHAELKKAYDLLYQISKHSEVVDIAAAKYDFHNIKVAMKAKYTKTDMTHLYSAFGAADSVVLAAYVKDPAAGQQLPAYVKEAVRAVETDFAETKDPQRIDIILDKLMFDRMIELGEIVGNDFIMHYLRLSIDYYNLKTMLRVKGMEKGTGFLQEAFVPGGLTDLKVMIVHYDKTPEQLKTAFYYRYFGDLISAGIENYQKTGNFSLLEKLFDDSLIEETKKVKTIAFGPEILFAYLLSKENEARQIRIMVTGKNNGIKTDILRERLRDNYA